MALVLASNLPDIDIVLALRSEPAYILFHRGLTHSLVGIAVMPPILAAGLWWGLGRRTSFRWLCLVAWAGCALHVAYDLVTPWGTMLLYPFAIERFAFDWLFIVDFVTWSLPLAAVLVAWRRPRLSRPAAAGYLVLLALYVALSGLAHREAREAAAAAEEETGRVVAEAHAFPRPFAPWRWHGIAVAPAAWPEPRVARYAVSGWPPHARLVERLARGFDDPWARRALATPDGQAFLWWAEAPVARVEVADERVRVALTDLRFERTMLPAADTTGPFSLTFEYDPATGALREIEW